MATEEGPEAVLTKLRTSVQEGDLIGVKGALDIVEKAVLVKHGGDLLVECISSESKDQAALIWTLVEKGVAPDAVSENYGCTALVAAAQSSDPSVIKALLDCGASVNAASTGSDPLSWFDSGTTPLMVASEGGRLDLVRVLLSRAADVWARDCRGANALWRAASRGHVDVMDMLRSAGATAEGVVLRVEDDGDDDEEEEDDQREDGEDATGGGDERREQSRTADTAEGGAVDRQHFVEIPLVTMAVCLGLPLAICQLLVEAGGGTEARDSKASATPLMWAAKLGREDVLRMLLSKGADPHARDRMGLSAIDQCLTSGLKALLLAQQVPGSTEASSE